MNIQACYLLRFDDICPTLNWRVWNKVEQLLIEHEIKPLLAVVPDNQDPELRIDPPAADFWDRIRACRNRGWTIALHGYQHRYVTKEMGLVGRRRLSGFAGLPADQQEEKIRLGVEILCREGLQPKAFIAPGHTFDNTTVKILPKYDIRIINDGFHRYPYQDKSGVIWIPQQIWRLQPIGRGVWTVCYHINGWGDAELEEFRRDLEKYRKRIVSLEHVLDNYPSRPRSWRDRLYGQAHLAYYMTRAELMLCTLYESYISHR